MRPEFTYIATFVVLAFCVILLDRKYGMLRCPAVNGGARAYSFSRVQLAWWSVIVLAGIVAVIISSRGLIPDLNQNTLILLGISAATVATASAIDTPSPGQAPAAPAATAAAAPPSVSENFFLDILSDQDGVNIHRFQTVVFNFVFGCWFVYVFCTSTCPALESFTSMKDAQDCINGLIPNVQQNNLILMGLSNATYAALKVNEAKQPAAPANPPA